MINDTPIPLLTGNHVLVRPHVADQAKHTQGVPNPEGLRSVHFPFSAPPPAQGRHAHGPNGRGRDFYRGQIVRVNNHGHYSSGEVAYTARSSDDRVFVFVEGVKIPFFNDPEFIVPMQ